MGGAGGETISIPVSFQATSPFGPVTEMRVSDRCMREAEMNAVSWEPFRQTRLVPYRIPGNNWFTFYVGVQYRDVHGNLSPVYCDELGVEGMWTPTQAP